MSCFQVTQKQMIASLVLLDNTVLILEIPHQMVHVILVTSVQPVNHRRTLPLTSVNLVTNVLGEPPVRLYVNQEHGKMNRKQVNARNVWKVRFFSVHNPIFIKGKYFAQNFSPF